MISRKIYGKVLLNAIGKAIVNLPKVLKPLYYFLFKGHIYTPNGIPTICVMMEQSPNYNSSVSISTTEKDYLGLPKAVVNWKLSNIQASSLKIYTNLLKEEFERLGLGTVKLADWLQEGDITCLEHLDDVFHHIGTTRMNADPLKGVVNTDCQIHGICNLFVAGCSVFPTSGSSNPTLMAMALAVRLADYIKNQITPTLSLRDASS